MLTKQELETLEEFIDGLNSKKSLATHKKTILDFIKNSLSEKKSGLKDTYTRGTKECYIKTNTNVRELSAQRQREREKGFKVGTSGESQAGDKITRKFD
jgi:hypothetical protein